MNDGVPGYPSVVDEPTTAATTEDAPAPDEPQVTSELQGHTAVITVAGELTEPARRPLVRCLTDLLLSTPNLHRVELRLGDVAFMNSAGMAVLVQLQKMAAPRGVEIVLVRPRAAVARPLQLSGLWHRFTVTEA